MKRFKLLNPNDGSTCLKVVIDQGINPRVEGGIYISHLDGKQETASETNLFDIPAELINLLAKPLEEILKHQELIAGSLASKTAVHAIATNALLKIKGK